MTRNFELSEDALKAPADGADPAATRQRREELVAFLLKHHSRSGELYATIDSIRREEPEFAADAFVAAITKLSGEPHLGDREQKVASRLLRTLKVMAPEDIPKRLAPLISQTGNEWLAFQLARTLRDGAKANAWSGALNDVHSDRESFLLPLENTERQRSRTAMEWKLTLGRRDGDSRGGGYGGGGYGGGGGFTTGGFMGNTRRDTGGAAAAPAPAPTGWPMPSDRVMLLGSATRAVRASADELEAFAWGKTADRKRPTVAPGTKAFLTPESNSELEGELGRYLDQLERVIGRAPALTDEDQQKRAAGLRLEAEMVALQRPARLALCETDLQRVAVRLDSGVRLLEVLLKAVRPGKATEEQIQALRNERAASLANPPSVFAEMRTNAYYNLVYWELLLTGGLG